MSKKMMAFRLSQALISRLKTVAKSGKTTVTALIERGAELAAREQEKKPNAGK